jgi:hypothetical protein
MGLADEPMETCTSRMRISRRSSTLAIFRLAIFKRLAGRFSGEARLLESDCSRI